MNGKKLLSLILALLLALGSLAALAEVADTGVAADAAGTTDAAEVDASEVADAAETTNAAEVEAAEADTAEAEDAAEPEPTREPPIAEGKGWTLASTGWLTLGPEAWQSFADPEDVAWYDYMDRIYGVEVLEGVKQVDNFLFSNAVNLRWVNLPDGLERIGMSAFSHCEKLQALTLPESVEHIDYWAFEGCYFLEEIVVGGMEQLDNYNFQACTGLLRAVIGEPVTRLGYDTLEDCAALRELYLPASLTLIDKYALRGCDALSDIYFAGSEAQWQAIRVEEGNEDVLALATVHFDSPWDAAAAAPVSALRPDYPPEDWVRLRGSLQMNYSERDYHGYIYGGLEGQDALVAEIGVDRYTLGRFLEDNHIQCVIAPRGASYYDTPCYVYCKAGNTNFDASVTLAQLREAQPQALADHLAFLEERLQAEGGNVADGPVFEEYGGMMFAVYRGQEADVYLTVLDGSTFLLFFRWDDGRERMVRELEEDIMSNIAHYTDEAAEPEVPEAPVGVTHRFMGGRLALTLDPAAYDVFLEDNSANVESLVRQGVGKDQMDLYMLTLGCQLMAVPAGVPFPEADWRFTLEVGERAYLAVTNLKALDDTEERVLCQKLADDFGAADWRLAETDDADYAVFEAEGSVRYATIIGQRPVYFTVKSGDGAVTDEQRRALEEIMRGVQWEL